MNNISNNINNIINTVESSKNNDIKLSVSEFKLIQSKLNLCVNKCIDSCDMENICHQCTNNNTKYKCITIGSFDLNDTNFPGCDLDKVRYFISKNNTYKFSKKYTIVFQLSQRLINDNIPPTYEKYYNVMLSN